MATTIPVPAGRRGVIPNLTIAGAARALELYEEALGAEVVSSVPAPDGKSVWHAEFTVSGSTFYCADEMPGMSPRPPTPGQSSPVSFWVWVKDCDAAWKRATEAGFASKGAPTDMFWGDRTGSVVDPFGYAWIFATHQKDLSRAEMIKAGEAFAKEMAQQQRQQR